tara:strand:- start:125 stop:271 length:147 start_codon:yes stop_codon:yes gene_type:complete
MSLYINKRTRPPSLKAKRNLGKGGSRSKKKSTVKARFPKKKKPARKKP